MGSVRISEGYIPGVVGRLTELHATYYGTLWELGPTFERDIAEGIAAFVGRYQSGRDGLWTALYESDTAMSGIVIDSRPDSEDGAQLRYFILHPSLHGQGLGRRLLDEALAFRDRQGFERVFLWTVDELEAAVHLYETAGFKATDEIDPHSGWRTTIPYRLFERRREEW